MRRSRLAISITVLALAGCWSLTVDLDVTGDTVGPVGADADARGDGALPGDEDGATRPEDASADDGAPVDGALADVDADGAPLGLCEGHAVTPRICDDFDTGALGVKWTRIENTGTGTSTFGTTLFKSAPRSYVARVASGCPAGDSAQLIDEAPGKPAEAKIDFDLSLAQLGATPSINLAGIQYLQSGGNGVYRIDLAFRDTRLELHQQSPFTILETSTSVFPFDTFKRVSITFTFVGTPRAIVKVDGVTALDKPIAAPAPTNNVTKLDFGVYVGAACQGPVEARFDNLLYFLTTQ